MIIDKKIRHKKLKYDINRKAAKISALSSGKVDKYLTGEEILPTGPSVQNLKIFWKRAGDQLLE